MRNSYPVGTVFFAGLATNERFSHGNLGSITIGGDRGDVEAASALNSENDECEQGVALEDITFLTTLELANDQVEDEVREVVQSSYDSIQEGTFTQSGKE